MGQNPHSIIDLSQVYKEDEHLVGEKAHELGILWKLGVPLPNGFVITADFFKEYLSLTGIDKEIEKVQAMIHPAISDSIRKLFHPIREKIVRTHMPQTLAIKLHKFYRKLSGAFGDRSLNVFASTSNNKYIAHFNVKGDANLILKIKAIWSLTLEEPVAIVVQENIASEIKGKIFTDSPIVDKKIPQILTNKLIESCKIIQKNFYFPKEIEYSVRKGAIFITKIIPFTGIISDPPKLIPQMKRLNNVLIKGISINPGIVTGPVRIINSKYSDTEAKKGEVIVLSDLNKFFFKRIKNAKAVITDSILQNSLDKTLYRKDFHIPTIIGTKNATKIFKNGNIVTVNGVSGEIYSGGLIY